MYPGSLYRDVPKPFKKQAPETEHLRTIKGSCVTDAVLFVGGSGTECKTKPFKNQAPETEHLRTNTKETAQIYVSRRLEL